MFRTTIIALAFLTHVISAKPLPIAPSPAQQHGLSMQQGSNQLDSKEQLSRAIEYFQSGKYHEALLLFNILSKEYTLNYRFQAYIGVCNFYDRNYEQTIAIFDSIMPRLDKFAPHEQSIYYYCAAESNYQLKHYAESLRLFEHQFLLCFNNEKGDALLRIGLCHRQLGNIPTAQEYLQQAVAYYRRFNDSYKLKQVEREMKYLSEE